MSKKFLNLLCSVKQKIWEIFNLLFPQCGVVFMFHEVYSNNQSPQKPKFAISESCFKSFIHSLLESHRFVSIHSYSDILNMNKGDIVITFDDGFSNAFYLALPFLRQYNIPYIYFVTKNFINMPGYITDQELKSLASDSLCTIGSHSVSHSKYRFSPEVLKTEVLETCKDFQTILLAYPYGSFFAISKKNRKDIESLHLISCAFSTLSSCLNSYNIKKRWMLPRICINDDCYKKYI